MKRIMFIMAIVAMVGVGCEREIIPNKIWDTLQVEFYEESAIVEPEGGEMVIPVLSTGVDRVYIDGCQVYPECGDKMPEDSWITFVEVIEVYDDFTRALPVWDSGIRIVVEPNPSGGSERRAWITVNSSILSDKIEVVQYAGCYGSEE